jgi:hypothetical protein
MKGEGGRLPISLVLLYLHANTTIPLTFETESKLARTGKIKKLFLAPIRYI